MDPSFSYEVAAATEGSDQKMSENNGVKEEEAEVEEKKDSDVVLREDLKVIFEKFGDVKYIYFRNGFDYGFIRFGCADAAQNACVVAVLSEKGGLVVKNFIANLYPLRGEAERKYWSLLRVNQDGEIFKLRHGFLRYDILDRILKKPRVVA